MQIIYPWRVKIWKNSPFKDEKMQKIQPQRLKKSKFQKIHHYKSNFLSFSPQKNLKKVKLAKISPLKGKNCKEFTLKRKNCKEFTLKSENCQNSSLKDQKCKKLTLEGWKNPKNSCFKGKNCKTFTLKEWKLKKIHPCGQKLPRIHP